MNVLADGDRERVVRRLMLSSRHYVAFRFVRMARDGGIRCPFSVAVC